MPNFYGRPTRKELHQKSLEESARKAERMEKYFANHTELDPENESHMDRAQKNYNLAYPESEEMIAKGYSNQEEPKQYKMTSYEAGTILSDRAVDRQEKTDEPYTKCFDAECEADPELSETYSHGE